MDNNHKYDREDDRGQVFITELSRKLRPLIQVIEDLQASGLEAYISLPRIAVVGEQSAGIFHSSHVIIDSTY